MTSQIWFIIGVIGFSLAGLLLFVTVLVFIRTNIPAVIGFLTGRTKAKQIEKLSEAYTETANRFHVLDDFHLARDELTKPLENEGVTANLSEETAVLDPVFDENKTMVLATTALAEEKGFRIVKSVTVIHTDEVIE